MTCQSVAFPEPPRFTRPGHTSLCRFGRARPTVRLTGYSDLLCASQDGCPQRVRPPANIRHFALTPRGRGQFPTGSLRVPCEVCDGSP